jgi:hypothetical protein
MDSSKRTLYLDCSQTTCARFFARYPRASEVPHQLKLDTGIDGEEDNTPDGDVK